jgi:hypothetical protein
LTTDRAEANRDRSPVSARITAALRAETPSMLSLFNRVCERVQVIPV